MYSSDRGSARSLLGYGSSTRFQGPLYLDAKLTCKIAATAFAHTLRPVGVRRRRGYGRARAGGTLPSSCALLCDIFSGSFRLEESPSQRFRASDTSNAKTVRHTTGKRQLGHKCQTFTLALIDGHYFDTVLPGAPGSVRIMMRPVQMAIGGTVP